MERNERPLNEHRQLGVVVILILGVLLLFHCKLSFCQSDESFYTALAHRLGMGDRLIVDEWHPAQLYAPILLPFYSLFRAAVPDGTGVYLFARRMYVLFSLIVSLSFYFFLSRKTSTWAACMTAVLPLLYSRANISGPSYYNLCLQFTILALVLACASKKRIAWILSGFFLALAVLCMPFLAPFVMLGVLALLFFPGSRQKSIFLLLGILFSATVYLLFLIQSSTVSQLYSSIGQLFKDSQHQDSLYEMAKRVYRGFRSCLSPLTYPVLVVACLIVLFSEKKTIKEHLDAFRIVYLFLVVLLTGATAMKAINSICFAVSVPVALLSMPFALKDMLKKEKSIALIMFLSGYAMAGAFALGSNTGLDAMTVGFTLSAAGGLLLITQSCSPNMLCKRESAFAIRALVICIGLIMIGTFSAHRFWGIYRDAPITELTAQIEDGPAAGLYTTDSHAEEYAMIHSTIRRYHAQYPDARVLFSKRLPWGYVASDWGCADYTAWTTPINDPRLLEYYVDHSEPNIIFLLADDTTSYESVPFNNHREAHNMNQNPLEGLFYQSLVDKGILLEQTPVVTVFWLG